MLQDEQLGGWRLKRTIDGIDKAEFRLDQNYVLRAGAKAKVSSSLAFCNKENKQTNTESVQCILIAFCKVCINEISELYMYISGNN